MSVADSRADHEAAAARLASAGDVELERDLTRRQMKLRELHAEAAT